MSNAGSITPRLGALRETTMQRTRAALAAGSLQPIETRQTLVEDGGVRFVIRQVSTLARKEADRRRHSGHTATRGQSVDPFQPYDPAMWVADLSPAHVCLLNKFPVLDHHLLIVTRRFEHQETLLNRGDFTALAACMAEFDGIAFYNGGTAAGASQPHKHSQLVALPLAAAGPRVPIEPLLNAAQFSGAIGTVAAFPFLHALMRLDPRQFAQTASIGAMLETRYRELLDAVGLRGVQRDGHIWQSGAYNLVLTREWMLVVPRLCEHVDSISINALGFAGSMFVRDAGQMHRIRRIGPLNVLRQVAVAADA